MTVDAEFKLTIKINDMVVSNNISGFELKSKIMEEGEKRVRLLCSGFLQDPQGKVIHKDVTYVIKED